METTPTVAAVNANTNPKPNPNFPPRTEMYRALLARDRAYEGVFVVGVRTTGIFCRPSCPARKPREESVEFHASPREALVAGFRPCRRCRPMEPAGRPEPWLATLLETVDREPDRRFRDGDLRALGASPSRVRRWFRARHGMTFQAYQRARRLGLALGRIRAGEDLAGAAFDHGWDSLSAFRDAFRKVVGEAPGRARETTRVVLARIETPLGSMVAGATDEGVCLLEFAERRALESQLRTLRARLRCAFVPGRSALLDGLAAEVSAYFDGRLRRFETPLVLPGTDFERRVWDALRAIPYGETRSYDAIARAIGSPNAVRAVGLANGRNRVAIVVPCHRVIGADGALRGYGGGLWRKRRLLELESRSTGPRL